MMSLREYRAQATCLADFLPWAALAAPGVVLNKDGSFQRTARFRGPDLDSATPAELVAVTARLNNALRRLGTGWAMFVEAQRAAGELRMRRGLQARSVGTMRSACDTPFGASGRSVSAPSHSWRAMALACRSTMMPKVDPPAISCRRANSSSSWMSCS